MASATTNTALQQPLELIKSDSDEYLFTVTEPTTTTPVTQVPIRLDQAVDGTQDRYAILRWTVKRSPEADAQSDALIAKDSQRGNSEISILDQTVPALEGQAEVLVDIPDTSGSDDPTVDIGDDPGHRHDLEVNRQDVERDGASQVGTVTVANGSNVVEGVGTAFLSAKVYDIINLTDGVNHLKPAIITAITSDTQLTVGRTIWIDAAGASFEIRRNRRRTAAAGTFALLTEVSSDG